MNLGDRIARLEARLRPTLGQTVPVLTMQVAFSDSDKSKPLEINHGGQLWRQAEGESANAFKERAKAGALAAFKPSGRFPVLMLVARHPPKENAQGQDRGRAAASPAVTAELQIEANLPGAQGCVMPLRPENVEAWLNPDSLSSPVASVQVGTSQSRMNKTRSNPPASGGARLCSARTHRRTGRHRSA